MSKKVFTILLLAVFMLAQFSVASAATAPGTATITLASPWGNPASISIDWSVTDLAGLGNQDIVIWSRLKAVPPALAAPYIAADCQLVANVAGSGNASGTFDFDITATTFVALDQSTVEFAITVDDVGCAGDPPATSTVNASAFIDGFPVQGFYAVPPYDGAAAFGVQPVSCNTFEMWALASDNYGFAPADPYSGFGSWRQRLTGTFAPPAPESDPVALLSWPTTIPPTASGAWSFTIQPRDAAFNFSGVAAFRNALAITPFTERADCTDFSDTAGHADEVYIRYLADLGLISGFADGTYGPDTTLSRAEAATLFEISNGYVPATLPTSAPSALCSFSDVAPTDWFAGWVWQACDDGYMNGIGGGLFDPNNLLTRGQIVTIMNNVADAGGTGGYLDNGANLINNYWAPIGVEPFRTAVFSDVFVGAFYAYPVQRAYGFGVAEGTSATTFSPDQPVLRGEFAKMLYRGLSNTAAIP